MINLKERLIEHIYHKAEKGLRPVTTSVYSHSFFSPIGDQVFNNVYKPTNLFIANRQILDQAWSDTQ